MPANRDAPSGFKPAQHMSGGTPGRLNRYNIVAAYATGIFNGDVVVPVNTHKRIARPAAQTDRPIGVFNSVFYTLADGTPKHERYWPAAQAVLTGSVPEALVYDDPDIVFQVQADEDIVLADIGAFADYVIGTGNTQTGISADELDSSQIGSGATLKLLDYVRAPDNFLDVNWTKCLVSFAIHYLRGAQTAI